MYLEKIFRIIKTCLDGTQSNVRIGNYFSTNFPINKSISAHKRAFELIVFAGSLFAIFCNCFNFPIENGLKQGDALSPLLLNFAPEYAIRKVSRN